MTERRLPADGSLRIPMPWERPARKESPAQVPLHLPVPEIDYWPQPSQQINPNRPPSDRGVVIIDSDGRTLRM